MDAPTETQFDVPVQSRAARDGVKSLDGAQKWQSKITGVLIAGIGMLTFVSRSGLGSGPNLSCTVLFLTLAAMVQHDRPIGQQLNVLLDNTCGDNKNNEMIFFLAWLVLEDITTEASFFCMMTGHTYSRIDQTFRTLIGQLLIMPIYTVGKLLSAIFNALRAHNCIACTELHCLWNWKAFFAPHVYERFGGFATGQFGSGMHEFVLRKDRHGEVRLWARKSSQASSWIPEGEGYKIFKSRPSGIPTIYAGKEDVKWGREKVESTVRSWFRFMNVSQGELSSIKAEWEGRFAGLPSDGDASQLADGQKLVWVDLPRRNQNATPATAQGLHGTSSSVENPPINPMTGPGRSNADVQRELAALHRHVRIHAPHAIFQGDYLFTRISGRLELSRVANSCFLDQAEADNLTFTTTTYEHHEQPGYQGFWGYFTLKKNPNYDPMDRKSGTVYVRNTNVSRTEVVMNDVQTFDTKPPAGYSGVSSTVLRVKVESLQKLATCCGEQPAVVQVPPTHGRDASSRGVGRGQGVGNGGRGRGAVRGGAANVGDRSGEGTDDDCEGGGGQGNEERADGMRGDDDAEEEGHAENERSSQMLARPNRVGLEMEIQRCDPETDECDYICADCPWDPCEVLHDDGRRCTVRMLDDSTEVPNVLAERYLRMPANAGRKRQRNLRLGLSVQA